MPPISLTFTVCRWCQPPSGTTLCLSTAAGARFPAHATVTVTVLADNPNDGPPAGNVMASIDGGVAQTPTAYDGHREFEHGDLYLTITASGTNHPVTANYVPMGTTAGGANWLACSGSGTVDTIFAVTVPVSVAGTLLPTPTAAGRHQPPAYIGSFTGHPQDWYSVTLTAGQTYVISIWTQFDSYMSLQYNGAEVAFNDDAWRAVAGERVRVANRLHTASGATGVYTVIVSDWSGGTGTYTLTIPNPTPTVTSVNPLNLPYSTSGAFSTSSYYGTAANDIGSPPIASEGQGHSAMGRLFSELVFLPADGRVTYTFTMTMTMATGANAVLSLQSGNSQVAYGYTTSATGNDYFHPVN